MPARLRFGADIVIRRISRQTTAEIVLERMTMVRLQENCTFFRKRVHLNKCDGANGTCNATSGKVLYLRLTFALVVPGLSKINRPCSVLAVQP